jgi:transcriptional regulator with XRE-family HTH domain
VQIRTARVAAGLSQRELGRMIGLSHQTIGRIERAEISSL